jgi:hypothetical protein
MRQEERVSFDLEESDNGGGNFGQPGAGWDWSRRSRRSFSSRRRSGRRSPPIPPPRRHRHRYAIPLIAIGPVASFIGGQVFGYSAFFISYRPG